MSDTVIRVEDLAKQYRLGVVGTGTIAHDLNRWWHRIRRNDDPYLKIGEENDRTKRGESDYVWALRDITFDVKQGDVVGIVGKNGAGKSTLLKLLSRTTLPTLGSLKVKGRIASLLEVGTGFHPELTGRENVFLNGAILGMTKAGIRKKFDEIVDFAGVEKYIDTPVKRYSSGMYVRLAFAVAAHLEPEILIVDEVLAVGDAEFQRKCLGKMQDVSSQGRTVLFVSHSMPSVRALCSRGILLKNGRIEFMGATQDTVEKYLSMGAAFSSLLNWGNFESAPGNDKIRIKSIDISPKVGNILNYDSGVNVHITFYNTIEKKNIDCTLKLVTRDEIVVFVAGVFVSNDKDSIKGIYKMSFEIPPHLLNSGGYKFSLIFGENQKHVLLKIDDIGTFEILNSLTGRGANHAAPPGVIRPLLKSDVVLVSETFQ